MENPKNKFAFLVFYMGTAYHGFQVQKKEKTIEGEIKKALIEGNYIDLSDYGNFSYSSRTDRGVHALEQIITFETEKKIIFPAINHLLNGLSGYATMAPWKG